VKFGSSVNEVLNHTINNFAWRKKTWDVISLNQPRGMSAKMAANGIRTHARTMSLWSFTLRLSASRYKALLLEEQLFEECCH